jgi:hypothetical protein
LSHRIQAAEHTQGFNPDQRNTVRFTAGHRLAGSTSNVTNNLARNLSFCFFEMS